MSLPWTLEKGTKVGMLARNFSEAGILKGIKQIEPFLYGAAILLQGARQ